MKYFVIFLFLLIPLLALLLFQNANGMLVGDGKEESDVNLVGKVLSFVENKTLLETNYLVKVQKYLKTPKNYDVNTKQSRSFLQDYDNTMILNKQ